MFWCRSKKGVSDVGQNFGVGDVGLRLFVKTFCKIYKKTTVVDFLVKYSGRLKTCKFIKNGFSSTGIII